MEPVFTITGTVMTVHLPEELDHYSAEKICAKADRLIQAKRIRCVRFDFEQTAFMDSSGIGMLIGRYKMMRFLGGTVMAVQVDERMNRILTLAGIEKIMDIYRTGEDPWPVFQREKG